MLARALHQDPQSRRVWKSMAKVHDDWAVDVLQKTAENRTVAQVKGAIESLKTAQRLFGFLAKDAEDEKDEKRKALYTKKVEYIATNVANAGLHLKARQICASI